jgi:hypothetical protein
MLPGPYTYQVVSHTGFIQILSVANSATGSNLDEVVSVTAAGQYSVNTSTGTITAFDGTPLLISYVSAGGTGASISIPNNLQGQSPVVFIAGVNAADGSGWLFPNCRVTGIKPLDLKNNAYAMNEVSFSVFCPAGQAVGQLFQQSV